MPSTQEHTAETAAGESIYSSDGLPLVTKPVAPPSSNANTTSTTDNNFDEYDTGPTMDPIHAFEMFHGRIFDTRGIGNIKQYKRSVHDEESPLEKIARLTAELADLETEWAAKYPKDLHTATTDVHEMATDLAGRLSTLASSNLQKHRQALTAVVSGEISKLVSSSSVTPAITSPNSKAVATKKTTTGVIHNRYESSQKLEDSLVATDDGTSNNTNNLKALVERIGRIEHFIGRSIRMNDKTVLERLQRLEEKLQKVDNKTLQAAAARAKVVRYATNLCYPDVPLYPSFSNGQALLSTFPDKLQSRLGSGCESSKQNLYIACNKY